jgi:DNA-binding CsgD family transcriptional regulator
MLETIREYAREQLDASGETEVTQRRHAEFYLELAETIAATLGGAAIVDSLAQLSTELPNLRTALAWSLGPGGDVDAGLRVATALSPFWRFRGHLSEGRRWLDAALAAGPVAMTTRIDGLVAAAELAIFHGECSAARALAQEGLDLATVHCYPVGEARAWFILGLATEFQGDLEQAEPLYRQAVERRDALGASHWTSRALACLADALYTQGDVTQAESMAEEALKLARTGGHVWSEALALGTLAHFAVDRGEYAEGLRLGLEFFDVTKALGAKLGTAGALGTLAGVFLAAGHPEHATRLLAAGRALGDSIGVVSVMHNYHYDQVLTEARHCLDERAFSSAWEAGSALSPEEALADVLAEPGPFARQAVQHTDNDSVLTPREREVLRLVAQGHSNQQIAEALFISLPTVKSHLSNLLGKLDLPSRSAATAYAHTHDLL